MLKRMIACLLTLSLLLTATPMVLAAKSPYDVDGSGGVTINDALLLFQYNVGLVEAFPSDVDVSGITKMDAVRAYREATNGTVKAYTETKRDELVSVTANYVTVSGKAGEVVSLPVYIYAEENSVLLLDVQTIVYDHTMIQLTDVVVSEEVAPSSLFFVNDDHLEIMYNEPVASDMIDLQFTVLQDFTDDMMVAVHLQDVSAVVEDDQEWAEATVDTEPGGLREVALEDLSMLTFYAEMLADDSLFTAESVATLNAALEAAQAVVDDPKATAEDISNAFFALDTAIQGLEELEETVEDAMADLQSLLDESNQLLAFENYWSEESYAILEETVDLVEMAIASDEQELTVDQINDLYWMLDEAIFALEFVGNYGDVDGDGSVAAADALLTLQAATGKIEMIWAQWMIADVDADEYGAITAGDALLILQFATQKIDSFPIDDMYIE